METFVDSAMTKHVIGALTEVSTRLSEQQKQIESLLAEATANAVHILDETSKFEENHLRRLKEIEEVVAKQSLDRQSNTISVHSRLEMLQAQINDQLTNTMADLLKSKESEESETKVLRLKVEDASSGFKEQVSSQKSLIEASRLQTSTNASTIEASRAATETAVNKLPVNVETMKTEYSAKSKRRVKEVSKCISAMVDVVEDVNAQAQEVLKSQVDALDQQRNRQSEWTTTFGASLEEGQRQAEEETKQIDEQLERLVQDENVFATEEITKNIPTGQTPKRRTFKFGGHDSILRTRDPNVIVEEFEENYQLNDSILQAFDAEDLDNSISSDVSAATADSGRPGSRATSRDPVGGPRAALKPVN